MCNSLSGKELSLKILDSLKSEIKILSNKGWKPALVSVTIGSVEAVDVYVRNQKRKAESIGIDFKEVNFDETITQEELRVRIKQFNSDPSITGIIIQRPVPEHINIKDLQSYVHPLKDVEGMNPASIGNIVYNELHMAPCTAMAAVELLKSTGVNMEGLEVVMVGHSAIVGKPAAFMLMAEGSTVTVCHHMTTDLKKHTLNADAIIVATGVPGLIQKDIVKDGCIIIDVGINIVEKDGVEKIVGDVDYDSVKDIAKYITPVPGGVGPVTVSILMRNTLIALKKQRSIYIEDVTYET